MTSTAQGKASSHLQELSNFVAGAFVGTAEGEVSDVLEPSTGEVYALAPLSGAADVDKALMAAAAAFEAWRDTTPAERSLALLRIADAIEARAAEITATECRSGGSGPRSLD